VATAVAVAAGTAGLATLVSVTSTSAQADPSFTTAYVGVGSDVTQDVYAALTGDSNGNFYPALHSSDATGDLTIESFDANPAGGTTSNPGGIATKLGSPTFDRPNSSTAGITALLDSVNGTGWENTSASYTNKPVNVTGQIDFARSARGPKTTGSTLTFVPFARDGLGILVYDHGDGNVNSLTTAQLTALYSSSTGTTTIGGDTVYACMTISGSTPRSNLEAITGLSDTQVNTAATAAGCNNLVQNSGNSFWSFAGSSSVPVGSAAVVPISAGSWISQNNGLAVDRSNLARTGGANLASITDGSTNLGLPYTGSGTSERPNTTYYQSTNYGYNLYTVLPTDDLSGFTANAGLESLFVGSGSALCASSAQSLVNSFGFDSLVGTEGTCGSTSTTGNS
jgi:hypothetical protein